MRKLFLLLSVTLFSFKLSCQEPTYLLDTSYNYKWNPISTDWEYTECEVYSYDFSGKLIEGYIYSWDTDFNDWVNSSHTKYIYDSSGNRTDIYNYDWDTHINDWVKSSHITNVHDPNGNLTEYYRYNWDAAKNDWVNNFHFTMSYNSNGNQTDYSDYYWDRTVNDWKYITYSRNEFDIDNKLTYTYTYNWNCQEQALLIYSYSSFVYNSSGNITDHQSYRWNTEMKDWINSSLNTHAYDSNGNETEYFYYRWDTQINEWVNVAHSTFFYDSSGNQVEVYNYSWDPVLNDWVHSSYASLIYKSNDGVHLAAQPLKIDFGTAVSGDTIGKTTVTLSSIGTDTLIINNITIPDSIFLPEDLPSLPVVLPPGQSESFNISFSPGSTTEYSDIIIITSNDQENPETTVSLEGTGLIFSPEHGFFYATAESSEQGQLLMIDPDSGQGFAAGLLDKAYLGSLTTNSSGELFTVRDSQLVRIDPSEGFVEVMAKFDLDQINALAIDSNDILYVSSGQYVYSVNLISGLTQQLSDIALLGGLAVDPQNDTLWGLSETNALYTIDKETGEEEFRCFAGGTGHFIDLSFDRTGNLYSISTITGNDFDLVRIDKNTGTITIIGNIDFEKVYGLAYYQVQQTTVSNEEFPIEREALNIYPNPSSDKLTVQFKNTHSVSYTLNIFDLTGKRVRSINHITDDTFQLERDGLTDGIYIIELRGPKIHRGKIVFE